MDFSLKDFWKGIIFRKIFDLNRSDPKIYDLFISSFYDFMYIFSIESVFLIVANGLIIIFELEQIEYGVASIIVGLIIFLFTSFGSYIRHKWLFGIGYFFTMLTIGAEFGYFLSYNLKNIWMVVFISIISAILGIVVLVYFFNIGGKFEFFSLLKQLLKYNKDQ